MTTLLKAAFIAISVTAITLLATGCGTDGIRTIPGPPGATGAPGQDGATGQTGAKGPAGETGLPGLDGKDGENASLVTIQLCPSIPGSFPEYLLVIPGSYYGVYYTGTEAFLSRLQPGNYRTTDGRNCTFSISATGEVK
jgi:hypothetical protein